MSKKKIIAIVATGAVLAAMAIIDHFLIQKVICQTDGAVYTASTVVPKVYDHS